MADLVEEQSPDSLCRDVAQTVIEFIADIRDSILTGRNERGDLVMVEFFFRSMHPLDIMQHCVDKILPHKVKIEERSNDFFVDNRGDIFKGLPQQRVDHLAEMLTSGKITAENQQVIWDYVTTILVLAERYKKLV